MPGFPAMSIPTLWVKKLGFVCKRRNRKLQVYQRLDIVASRQRYLRPVRELMSAGYKGFYQDETWCNADHTREYTWQLDDETERDFPGTLWKGRLRVSTASGKRLIVNHLGWEDGFLMVVKNALLELKTVQITYHKEMNNIHFERWWEDSVLPNRDCQQSQLSSSIMQIPQQTNRRIQSAHHKLEKRTNSRLVTKEGVDFQRNDTIPTLLQKLSFIWSQMYTKLRSQHTSLVRSFRGPFKGRF